MGMNLSRVKAATDTVEVTWGNEQVVVTYHPAAITPEVLERVQDAATDENLSVVSAMLEPLLAGWELYADDDAEAAGVQLPTNAETIRQVPLPFLMAVMEQTQEAMRPPAQRPSAGGSARRAS